MRIAVDARPLAPPLTGIGVYTSSLLENLVDTGHQWFLYGDRPLAADWSRHPAVTVRHAGCEPRSLASLLVANRDFLRWSSQDRVDVFWSPRHHLPFLLPRDLPGVVTIHDMVWRRFPETLPLRNRLLERAAMGRSLDAAREVIAVSDFTASEIGHFYPSAASKCRVIPEAGRALGTPVAPALDRPWFLFVGTLEPRKNLPLLLQAFAQLVENGRLPHQLVVVGGEGWGDVSLRQSCDRLGIAERVTATGYVGDAELAGWYAGAEALVLPSLYEGFGLPLVEAMARGVPLVVSDRGALPEVAGAAGLVVDGTDAGALCRAMTRMAEEPDLRRSLAAAALERASRYSWERAASETLAVLESAAAA